MKGTHKLHGTTQSQIDFSLGHTMWGPLSVSLVCYISFVNCVDILAVFPTISKSHFVVFEPLLKELSKRGHNLTVISTFSQSKSVDNYTNIDVRLFRKFIESNFSVNDILTPISTSHVILEYIDSTEAVLKSPQVLALTSSNASFDLVFHEMFLDDVFLGFAHKFSAPVIAFGSCYMFPWVVDRFQIPGNPSYVPIFGYGFPRKMSFLSRIQNMVISVYKRAFYKFIIEPKSSNIVQKYFGNTAPTVGDLVKNTSLYFVNTHSSFFGGQPYPPQVVDVSGIHLKSVKPLQQVYKFLIFIKFNNIYNSFNHGKCFATLIVYM